MVIMLRTIDKNYTVTCAGGRIKLHLGEKCTNLSLPFNLYSCLFSLSFLSVLLLLYFIINPTTTAAYV